MTSDNNDLLVKIFIGFIGATIALILNRLLKYIDDSRRYKKIRELIVSDLRIQLHSLSILAGDLYTLLPLFQIFDEDYTPKGQRNLYRITLNVGLQTDTFKSQTRLDFFKAFNESDFQDLMFIYSSIKTFEQIDLLKIKDDFLNEYARYDKDEIANENTPEKKDTHLEATVKSLCMSNKNKLYGYLEGINGTDQRINKLINDSLVNYDTYFDKLIFWIKLKFKKHKQNNSNV